MARILLQSHPEMSWVLSPLQVIGRAPTCRLRDQDGHVSAHHAQIRWNGRVWMVSDLGSRNGTWLDSKRLPPHQPHQLRKGGVLGLGRPENAWVLTCAAPPNAMGESSDGRLIEGPDGLLALPHPDSPILVIYKSHEGAWVMDSDDGTEPVKTGQVVTAGTTVWTLFLPDAIIETLTAGADAPVPRSVELRLGVAPDGKHVDAAVVFGGRTTPVAPRASHTLLLHLARARLADQVAGMPLDEQGWLDAEDVLVDLDMTTSHLHVAIYRMRKQFGDVGLGNPTGVIERRSRPSHLRLGIVNIDIDDR